MACFKQFSFKKFGCFDFHFDLAENLAKIDLLGFITVVFIRAGGDAFIDFKKYPIIRIDFTGLFYAEGLVGFKNSFFNKIKNIGLDYQIELKSLDYKTASQELIIELSKIESLVNLPT